MRLRRSPNRLPAPSVQEYYEHTWIDYRLFWFNPYNRAIHFGYWNEHTRTHAESLIEMNRQMAARARLARGQRVLDAGCGVGGTALWLAREYGVRVVGITIVPNQLARAQRLLQERRLGERVQFLAQDFHHTDFPAASFEVVWTQESIVHSRDKRAFLAEAYRLLKPGGAVVMLEYFRNRRPYAEADEKLLRSWATAWAMDDLPTGEEFLAWARDAGFESVALEDIEMHVRPSHLRLHRLTQWTYWGESLLHALRLRSDIQHGNIRAARDLWQALQRGLWYEGILTAWKPQ